MCSFDSSTLHVDLILRIGFRSAVTLFKRLATESIYVKIRGLLEKYPTFGREKETGLLGALDT